MMEEGVCALLGLETALAAIRAAQTPAGVAGWRPVPALPPREARMLTEAEGKALLASAGVAVPGSVSGATLAEVAGKVRFSAPYALKGLGFAHKTEAGAVRLGLTSLEGQTEMPGASGYLVEEMVTGAVAEVLLGLRRDPVYGVSLTLGMGGVTAEVLAPEDGLGGVGRGAVWAGGSGAGAGVGRTNGLGRLSLRRVFLALRFCSAFRPSALRRSFSAAVRAWYSCHLSSKSSGVRRLAFSKLSRAWLRCWALKLAQESMRSCSLACSFSLMLG